jgi:hypothetical protein
LPEAIADFVTARRVRGSVARICEAVLNAPTAAAMPKDQMYWILATLWEAAVGVDDAVAAEQWRLKAEAVPPLDWMLDSTRTQIERLRTLLATSPLQLLGPKHATT